MQQAKSKLYSWPCSAAWKSDHRSRLTELLAGSLDLKMPHHGLPNRSGDMLTLTVPASLKRAGREMRMLVENADDQTAADPSLLRILARAHHIHARLSQCPKLTVHDIAREEQVSAAYLYTLLRLPWLAPDITMAIINGRKPSATHRPDIDAPDAAAAGKLGRTAKAPRLSLKTNRRSPPCKFARAHLGAACNRFEFTWRSLLRRRKSQPRNSPGEIFMTVAGEIARTTVSAANRFEARDQ